MKHPADETQSTQTSAVFFELSERRLDAFATSVGNRLTGAIIIGTLVSYVDVTMAVGRAICYLRILRKRASRAAPTGRFTALVVGLVSY